MKRVSAISLMTLCLAAGPVADVGAQDAAQVQNWQLDPPEEKVESPLSSIFASQPLGFGNLSPLADRPRLSVSLSPSRALPADLGQPAVSWSLEAWEMNTASLAHIQCSRATRTIESFLVENCRFVDQPLPDNSGSLVQVQGRWMATPGLTIGAGAYTGRQSALTGAGPMIDPATLAALSATNGQIGVAEDIHGLNMNVSFGLSLGQVGSLMLDLQVERYRRSPASFSLSRGLAPASFDYGSVTALDRNNSRYSNAGQMGVAWRGSQFGADLSGQYQELPYWTGEQMEGEGFRSFDLEFSWRAPMQSSISIGVSNVLDRLPGAANAADQGMEEAVDGIYGRIPYVRYKHDL